MNQEVLETTTPELKSNEEALKRDHETTGTPAAGINMFTHFFNRKTILLIVGAVVALVAIIMITMHVISAANERREVREALEAQFRIATQEHEEATQYLVNALQIAQPVANKTTRDQLEDPKLLDAQKTC